MAENKKILDGGQRSKLAYGTLIFSGSAITILALVCISKDPDNKNAMTIFNIVLPVFASWVGTILAFYFGRENFESANEQVRELVHRLTPEERARKPVTSIMRSLFNMELFKIPNTKQDKDIALTELLGKFSSNISRLPIIDHESKPKYIVHESRINKYIASGGDQNDTLAKFIQTLKKEGFGFGLDKGFVVVSEQSTLGSAKRKMEGIPSCQDIFITKDGGSDEPLTGWISNIRLAKYMEM